MTAHRAPSFKLSGMNNVTVSQTETLLKLAGKYGPAVLKIVSTGDQSEIALSSFQEAKAIEAFSNHICSWVLKDYPDYSGRDEDMNDDAALVANIASKVVAQFYNVQNPN